MPNNDDLDIGGSGEFTPYLKFNSKANQWSWRGEESEVQLDNPVFAMDLANIQTAWLRFGEGEAPDRLVDVGGRAPRPSDRHKRGFIVRVFSRQSFSGAGEFSSNAIGVCNVVKELHRAYKEQAAGHQGQVPIVHVTGTDTFKGKFGSNYTPRLEIKTWVARPAEMPDEPVFPVKGNGDARPKVHTSDIWGSKPKVAPAKADLDDLDDEIVF
jgi:hypothetical protein